MTPKFVITHASEYSTRVFCTDSSGRGLWQETADGRNRQLVGTCDAGPFASEDAFRAYVARHFSHE